MGQLPPEPEHKLQEYMSDWCTFAAAKILAITSISVKESSWGTRVVVVSELSKLRLASLVVLSAVFGYFIARPVFDWRVFLGLLLGGTLVTSGANTFNQILERVTDGVMLRTQNRPLPRQRISVSGAVWLALLLTGGGFSVLWWLCNPLTAYLSLLSWALYVWVYTPLKTRTPLAVFVGAVPGAMPPLLGWVASRGYLGLEAYLLFLLQFLWQFPHFWAIAWRLHDDYQKAGIYLLPLRGGPSQENARIILLYTLLTIPAALLPFVFGIYGTFSMVGIALLGLLYSWPAWKLAQSGDARHALHLLYASFLYLPLMQLLWLLNV